MLAFLSGNMLSLVKGEMPLSGIFVEEIFLVAVFVTKLSLNIYN
jgi:hypothetical protein